MIKLASLLKEEPLVPVDQAPEHDNTYMFFQNLETIFNAVKELIEMDKAQVSKLLADDHGWALDHISTATDDVTEVHGFVKTNLTEPITEAMGAFRRLVVTSGKMNTVKQEVEDFIKRPNIKSDFPDAKISVKPGIKPNVLVVDVEAISGTALANKISDVVKKFDKAANIKVRKELKLKPSK